MKRIGTASAIGMRFSPAFYFAILGLLAALVAALALVFGVSVVVNVALGIVVAFFFAVWIISLEARDRAWGPLGGQMRRSWKRAWPKRKRRRQ